MPSAKEPVEIIVVGYNLPDMEADCLKSVLHDTDWPYVLTYYDNYETGKSLTQVWNWRVKASTCPYICLLNSDTVVTPQWMSRMMEPMRDPKVGFVGPSTNHCNSPQSTIPSAEEAAKRAGKVKVMKDPISGFCLLLRKSIWHELNGFDERYAFYGQESDFIDRAQKRGYVAVWRQDAFVYHYGQKSIANSKMDVTAERKKARELYWRDRKP